MVQQICKNSQEVVSSENKDLQIVALEMAKVITEMVILADGRRVLSIVDFEAS